MSLDKHFLSQEVARNEPISWKKCNPTAIDGGHGEHKSHGDSGRKIAGGKQDSNVNPRGQASSPLFTKS